MIFLSLIFIPILISLAAFIWLKTIHWIEFLASIGATAIIAGISMTVIYYCNVGDTEVCNGSVVSKSSQHVSCSHSYQCRCHEVCSTSGSGKNRTRSCHQECDTCYEHAYDVNWNVFTSNDETITIGRVDRQGLVEPPRYSAVAIGEPTAVEHYYTNYIKADSGTLFKRSGFENISVPSYPQVFDYYKLNHAIGPFGKDWQQSLSELNSQLGKKKQVNILIVATNKNTDFYYALQQQWLGGKKNDVVLVLGLDNKKIVWANVLAWSKTEDLKVHLRDDVLAIGVLDKDKIIKSLDKNINQYYQRKPMEEFSYLQAGITPTLGQFIAALIVTLIVSIGLTIYFHFNEFDKEDSLNNNRRRRWR